MKNIHVLPTDKPSRLWVNNLRRRLELDKDVLIGSNTAQHIYITSDDTAYPYALHLKKKEVLKIKGVGENSGELYHDKGFNYPDECRKIILTTDTDLIKDGVQAIPDEFLEWFVKNPNCEYVETEIVEYGFDEVPICIYKIIIPKEESKQETLINNTDSHSWGFENFEVIKTEEDAKIFIEALEKITEPNEKLKKAFREYEKQETVEEAAENHQRGGYDWQKEKRKSFIEGAKWQQERMYSEEEVNLLSKMFKLYWYENNKEHEDNLQEWELSEKLFEQFKNK